MSPRVILLGATGYTGRLTAAAMARGEIAPVLAGRHPADLERLAAELGLDDEPVPADVTRPGSVQAAVEAGDVLVSTVGPFATLGDAAAEAAVRRRATYIDCNGEPEFTRRVFERHGPAAAAAGVGMLTAIGWECVLGNLAGALALREAGEAAVRVDTGYFYVGRTGYSGGSRASFADAMLRPSFAYRDGAIHAAAPGRGFRTMTVGQSRRGAIALGASEHYALPRSFPHLREVNAYLGWFGGLPPAVARALRVAAPVGAGLARVPRLPDAYAALRRRLLRGSSGGPSPEQRAGGGVHVVGIAYDAVGTELAEVRLQGAEGYEFTAEILAWAAERALAGALRGSGALGPVEAFGIDELEAGCRQAGVARMPA